MSELTPPPRRLSSRGHHDPIGRLVLTAQDDEPPAMRLHAVKQNVLRAVMVAPPVVDVSTLSQATAATSAGATAASMGTAGVVSTGTPLVAKVLLGVALATAGGGAAVYINRPHTQVAHETPLRRMPEVPEPMQAPPAVVPATSPMRAMPQAELPTRPSTKTLKQRSTPREAAPRTNATSPSVPSTLSTAPVETPSEAALLVQARQWLARDPAATLAVANKHRALFGEASVLGEEREVLAIEALARLHRTADCQARAQIFKRRFPGSAYGDRVQRAVGQTP